MQTIRDILPIYNLANFMIERAKEDIDKIKGIFITNLHTIFASCRPRLSRILSNRKNGLSYNSLLDNCSKG